MPLTLDILDTLEHSGITAEQLLSLIRADISERAQADEESRRKNCAKQKRWRDRQAAIRVGGVPPIPPASITVTPEPPTTPQPDSMSDETWLFWLKQPNWPSFLGPKRGEPGSRVPARVLIGFDLEQGRVG